MRLLVVFAHPRMDSTCGDIFRFVERQCHYSNYDLEVLNLYDDLFDPILNANELGTHYNDKPMDASLSKYREQIQKCEAMVWIYPTWYGGFPAILKGYLDRIWRPNVAFEIAEDKTIEFSSFDHIRYFVAITTFGASWKSSLRAGLTSRLSITCMLARHFSRRTKIIWLATYGRDCAGKRRPEQFLSKVGKTISSMK